MDEGMLIRTVLTLVGFFAVLGGSFRSSRVWDPSVGTERKEYRRAAVSAASPAAYDAEGNAMCRPGRRGSPPRRR